MYHEPVNCVRKIRESEKASDEITSQGFLCKLYKTTSKISRTDILACESNKEKYIYKIERVKIIGLTSPAAAGIENNNKRRICIIYNIPA